jgi:transcriptional regulator with XRE-family HTH domain
MHTKKTSKLPDIMKEQGVTVDRLMDLTGLSKQTVIRLRREDILYAKYETLQKVARALEVKVDDLFH